MKKLPLLTGAFAFLLLAGAGCNATEYDKPTYEAKPAENNTMMEDTSDAMMEPTDETSEDNKKAMMMDLTDEELQLAAEVLGNRAVQFTWGCRRKTWYTSRSMATLL